jgi:dTMP kinase
VRRLYSFAALPDLTFFFKAPLDVSLGRILRGRPQLKYHEAGMDLGLSSDIEESFKLFQGRLLKVYSVMKSEFGLIQINANQPIEKQQEQVRQRLAGSIDLGQYELDKLS